MKEPHNTNNSSFGGGQKNLTLDRVTSINDKKYIKISLIFLI